MTVDSWLGNQLVNLLSSSKKTKKQKKKKIYMLLEVFK